VTLWPTLVYVVIVLWVLIIIFLIKVIRFGKKSDIDKMKILMDTNDDDLAKTILKLEEDDEQEKAIRKQNKHRK